MKGGRRRLSRMKKFKQDKLSHIFKIQVSLRFFYRFPFPFSGRMFFSPFFTSNFLFKFSDFLFRKIFKMCKVLFSREEIILEFFKLILSTYYNNRAIIEFESHRILIKLIIIGNKHITNINFMKIISQSLVNSSF